MKALLVTLQSTNIGNRLQNYALQTMLQKIGCEIYTPVYVISECTVTEKVKYAIKVMLGKIGVNKYRIHAVQSKRKRLYTEFDKKYISNRITIGFDSVQYINWDEYDIAFTGSDQVWHKWSDNPDELKYFYLQFMDCKKRVAYAPSFGFDIIPEEDLFMHINGIKEMACLSARELSGKKILEEIRGEPVDLVLDPTLLLAKEEWEYIEAKPRYYIPERFILVYFLGEKTTDYNKIIQDEAKKLEADIIDIFDLDQLQYYYTRPDEFLWLIDHAISVVTDSFHACVFSIIFHKPFKPLRRVENGFENMYGRIDSLLKMCCLHEIELLEGNSIEWSSVDMLLSKEKTKSIDYIKKAITYVNASFRK